MCITIQILIDKIINFPRGGRVGNKWRKKKIHMIYGSVGNLRTTSQLNISWNGFSCIKFYSSRTTALWNHDRIFYVIVLVKYNFDDFFFRFTRSSWPCPNKSTIRYTNRKKIPEKLTGLYPARNWIFSIINLSYIGICLESFISVVGPCQLWYINVQMFSLVLGVWSQRLQFFGCVSSYPQKVRQIPRISHTGMYNVHISIFRLWNMYKTKNDLYFRQNWWNL